MTGINLTLIVDPEFDDSSIMPILDKFGLKKNKNTNEHQLWIFKGNDLVVQRYQKTILMQGQEHTKNLDFIRKVMKIDGLSTNRQNAEKLAKLFKISHNALFCMECNAPSMLIQGRIDELDIVFEMECGHENDLNPPIFMLTNRILPDINILINGNLSRCIDMGFFNGFEVVIPDFVMHALDFLNAKNKSGASNELKRLQQLENDNKISLFRCIDGIGIPDKDEFDQVEDDKILEIANLTNSILLTGDQNLKDKARVDRRPTIYIHPKDGNQIKIIYTTRFP